MPDPDLIYSKILFTGVVFDNQDPMMLGRVRASGLTDNVQSLGAKRSFCFFIFFTILH